MNVVRGPGAGWSPVRAADVPKCRLLEIAAIRWPLRFEWVLISLLPTPTAPSGNRTLGHHCLSRHDYVAETSAQHAPKCLPISAEMHVIPSCRRFAVSQQPTNGVSAVGRERCAWAVPIAAGNSDSHCTAW